MMLDEYNDETIWFFINYQISRINKYLVWFFFFFFLQKFPSSMWQHRANSVCRSFERQNLRGPKNYVYFGLVENTTHFIDMRF